MDLGRRHHARLAVYQGTPTGRLVYRHLELCILKDDHLLLYRNKLQFTFYTHVLNGHLVRAVAQEDVLAVWRDLSDYEGVSELERLHEPHPVGKVIVDVMLWRTEKSSFLRHKQLMRILT